MSSGAILAHVLARRDQLSLVHIGLSEHSLASLSRLTWRHA
jgi:hypothetical protein